MEPFGDEKDSKVDILMTMKSDFKDIFDEDGEEKLQIGKKSARSAENDHINVQVNISDPNSKQIHAYSKVHKFSLRNLTLVQERHQTQNTV